MKRLFLVLLVGGLAVWGLIAVLRGPGREFTAAILGDNPEAAQNTEAPRADSFVRDSDQDGLSDGKEKIYGTDERKADTDGDGIRDGDETRNGTDPTVHGESLVRDSAALMENLTIRYFVWARDFVGFADPQLNDDAVRRFLDAEGVTTLQLPTVTDAELKLIEDNSDDAVRAYFEALARIQLPNSTAAYTDLAEEVIQSQQSAVLDDVLVGFDLTIASLRAVPTPPKLAEVHRQQVALLKALKNLFVDLYRIEGDPVLLVRDIAWGQQIFTRSVEVDRDRRLIAEPILVPETTQP
jgi:hypothetical protein